MYRNLVESYFHGEGGNGLVCRLRHESETIISECLISRSLISPCIFSILFHNISNGIDKENLVNNQDFASLIDLHLNYFSCA